MRDRERERKRDRDCKREKDLKRFAIKEGTLQTSNQKLDLKNTKKNIGRKFVEMYLRLDIN